MELLKKHKLLQDKKSKVLLDPKEVNEIAVIEALLPLQALIVFRQLVMKEVILLQHRAQQEKDKAKPTRRVSTFFKNRFGSKKKDMGKEEGGENATGQEEDEEDISIQTVRSLIYGWVRGLVCCRICMHAMSVCIHPCMNIFCVSHTLSLSPSSLVDIYIFWVSHDTTTQTRTHAHTHSHTHPCHSLTNILSLVTT